MVTVGRAILNHTLLSPAITRRWFRPVAPVSGLGHAVGAPWEIYPFENSRVVDIYTKTGDAGVYSSMLALSPTHGVGFTIMAAGNDTHLIVASLADLISNILIPALDESAKEEARKRFTGTYALTQGINSSITISTDDGPGLVVTSWLSNSTDMFETFAYLHGVTDPSLLSIRLYPTDLKSPGRLSFRALMQQIAADHESSVFAGSCATWQLVGFQIYGNVATDEFVFELDENGDAVSVSPRVLRISLPKV